MNYPGIHYSSPIFMQGLRQSKGLNKGLGLFLIFRRRWDEDLRGGILGAWFPGITLELIRYLST
jgi:hypothetical protein